MNASALDQGTSQLPEQKIKVFISYSRADLSFADEIVAGLELLERFDVAIDRHAIHAAENWRERLGELIATADAVAFILSSTSAAAPICQWEVEEAARLSKRIVPILMEDLHGVLPPPQLAALNYVKFNSEADGKARSFLAALAELRQALTVDIGWLREHNRLLTRAREWDMAGRPDNRLLFGNDVAEAKRWLSRHTKDLPSPIDLQRDFIAESDQKEAARNSSERARAQAYQRVNTGLKFALAAAIILGSGAAYAGFVAYQKSVEAQWYANRLAALQSKQGEPPVQAPSSGIGRGEFLDKAVVAMEQDGRAVKLLKPFSFKDSSGRIWTAPAGFVSDGASIPQSLWSLVGTPFSGKFQIAIIHDYYVRTEERSWQDTHKMFYEGLIAAGESETQAKLLYSALYFSGPRWEAKGEGKPG